MSTWQEKIPGCFGYDDKKFGIHPLDERRARELRRQLDKEGVAWVDVKKEIERHLNGCAPGHVDAEVIKAKKLLGFNKDL